MSRYTKNKYEDYRWIAAQKKQMRENTPNFGLTGFLTKIHKKIDKKYYLALELCIFIL